MAVDGCYYLDQTKPFGMESLQMADVITGERPPVVVGGTGGSGTRAVARFLRRCGLDMGESNTVADALAFVDVLDKHINEVLRIVRGTNYDASQLEESLRNSILQDYRAAAFRHKRGMAPNIRWGFKNPRHIFLLPLLDVAFPGAVFIHLVRDGRDMLLSENKRQAVSHFEALFGEPFTDSPADVARFWAATNTGARAYGLRHLGARYINVRIEDLCGPEQSSHIRTLAELLGLNTKTALDRADKFELRESYGRGHLADINIPPKVREEFSAALAEFQY